MANENKFKHLDMIQGVVNRLAGNSFMIKGWCITLVAALFVLGEKEGTRTQFLFIALIPIIAFWILDTFYLRGERQVRELYKKVAQIKNDDEIDFSMNVKPYEKEIGYWKVFLSKTILGFYLPFVLLILILIYMLGCFHWSHKTQTQSSQIRSFCAPFSCQTSHLKKP